MTSVVGAIGIARIESRHCSYIITGSTGNITLFTCRSIKIKTIYARLTTGNRMICASWAIRMTEIANRFIRFCSIITKLNCNIWTNIKCMISLKSLINIPTCCAVCNTSSSSVSYCLISWVYCYIKEIDPCASRTSVRASIVSTSSYTRNCVNIIACRTFWVAFFACWSIKIVTIYAFLALIYQVTNTLSAVFMAEHALGFIGICPIVRELRRLSWSNINTMISSKYIIISSHVLITVCSAKIRSINNTPWTITCNIKEISFIASCALSWCSSKACSTFIMTFLTGRAV